MDFSQKQSDALHFLEDKIHTEVFFGGSAGPGKSFLGCAWHIGRRVKYPGSRGVIGRAKISNLEETTLVTLFKVADLMGYKRGLHYNYNSQKHKINWCNGSVTVLKDLFFYPSDPDFIGLGSTEYTDGFIDEATEITKKAFEILNSRIRFVEEFGLIPKILLVSNPGPGWVKETFIINKGQPVKLQDDQVFVRALLPDNPDPAFREMYRKKLEKLSEYDRARLLDGDWEAERDVLNPFCNQYDPTIHESNAPMLFQGRQLIVSIDFNLNPFAMNAYQTWQDSNGLHAHQVGEASIEKGSIPAMIELIKSRYQLYLPTLKITGDYSGTAGQLSQADNASYYEQIRRGLKLRDSQMVLVPNPRHSNSRNDVNYFLEHFPDFKINPVNCPDSCRDMKVVQCDAFGSIIKKVRSDLTQQADHLDCFRSFIHAFMRDWIEKHQKGWYKKK